MKETKQEIFERIAGVKLDKQPRKKLEQTEYDIADAAKTPYGNEKNDIFTFDVRKPQFRWFMVGVLFSIVGFVNTLIWIYKMIIG